jgi:polyhydroxybutyrate depolymerase
MSFKLIVWVLAFCVFLSFGVSAAGTARPAEHFLVVDGIERSYIVYSPVAAGTGKVPLMIVLHGGLGNAGSMEQSTQMNAVAEENDFIVVYPNGTGGRFGAMKNRRTWNAGGCCGQAVRQNVDDVLFIQKLIEEMGSRYPVDTQRVYVTGMSNGAMMAYRLACEIPDMIAAIIPVSGTLAVDNCDRAKTVPVLHIHGDQDENVPFDGGMGTKSVAGVSHRSVPDTIELLVQPRQCRSTEKSEQETGATRVISYDCADGAPVTLVVIKGGGHVWPGGQGLHNQSSDGPDISASRLAWDFAKQFSKKAE